MANYCTYIIKAKGPNEDLTSLTELLQADYNYSNIKNEARHLKTIYEKKISVNSHIHEIFKNLEELQDKTLFPEEMTDFINDQLKITENAGQNEIPDLYKENLEESLAKFKNLKLVQGIIDPSEKPHLMRVFSADVAEGIGNTIYISGSCAWSVETCMLESESAYKNTFPKNNNIPSDVFIGTTLNAWAKEHPDTTFEIISCEPGIAFCEHYVFENGTMTVSECNDFEYIYIEDSEERDEMLKNDELSGDIAEWVKDETSFPLYISISYPEDYVEPSYDFDETGTFDFKFSI